MTKIIYLTDMPDNAKEFGLCKTLAVRHEVIHLKHILTEIFVRKTIDIEKYLNPLNMSLFEYMEIMTNRLRKVHNFSRKYIKDCNDIVKKDRDKFFPTLKLLDGFSKKIILDFDGVTTSTKFSHLYELCCSRENVEICSANPTITNAWFDRKEMTQPQHIHSMKGKIRKIKRLIRLQRESDYLFFIDDEIEYLEYAWLFGIQTYLWDGVEIKHHSMKTK